MEWSWKALQCAYVFNAGRSIALRWHGVQYNATRCFVMVSDVSWNALELYAVDRGVLNAIRVFATAWNGWVGAARCGQNGMPS
eukprot:10461390-Lingulodinium_polyedra.AAC.1